jgi:hypothetical protein
MALQDLVSKIDKEHLYVYATEYSGFIKTKLKEDTDG